MNSPESPRMLATMNSVLVYVGRMAKEIESKTVDPDSLKEKCSGGCQVQHLFIKQKVLPQIGLIYTKESIPQFNAPLPASKNT